MSSGKRPYDPSKANRNRSNKLIASKGQWIVSVKPLASSPMQKEFQVELK